MKLRNLKEKDAPLMLEWMHDPSVVEYMKADFAGMTITDCENFIAHSSDKESLHMAITDDEDEYMGTVSLKHIDHTVHNAEFAITIRKCAMGGGYAAFGMREIVRIGLDELGLKSVIWCVSKMNIRANKFYQKNGYRLVDNVPENIRNRYEDWDSLNWYEVV